MLLFKLLRMLLHVATVLVLVVAIAFIGVALCTPYWRSAHLDSINEHHYYGLWEHCLQLESGAVLGDITCALKESKPDHNYNQANDGEVSSMAEKTRQQEYLRHWEISTIILLTFAVFFGIFAVIFGFLSAFTDYCKYKPIFICLSITWCVLHLIGTILATAGIILYLRHSFDIKNRFFANLTTRKELKYGPSFYNCAIGVIMFAVSLIFSVASVILVCMFAHRERHEYTQVRYTTGGITEKVSTF